jgi:hypothetical protein
VDCPTALPHSTARIQTNNTNLKPKVLLVMLPPELNESGAKVPNGEIAQEGVATQLRDPHCPAKLVCVGDSARVTGLKPAGTRK